MVRKRFQHVAGPVVPGAMVRRAAHFGRDLVLMSRFINIAADVRASSMVDTSVSVGYGAQIDPRCHLSRGVSVGIDGVLEPLQAVPTIIEDDCFIGTRPEVLEGVTAARCSVIGMGVFLDQCTKTYDRVSGEVTHRRVPVAVGSVPTADDNYSLCCVVTVKKFDERTRSKTSINEPLRRNK